MQIEELGRIVTGKTPSTKNPNYFNGQYPFVTPSDIDFRNYYCRATGTTVTEEAKTKHKNQFIPKNCPMITCIGNTIGKCAISSEECVTNQQINSIIPYSDFNFHFVYYLMLYNEQVIRGIGIGGGSATPILNKTKFSKIKVKVPPKPVRDTIADILSAYDDLIENNRQRIALLEQAARLLYREWFVYLRFPGHEHVKIVDGVPEGWRKASVSDFGEVITGKTPSTKQENYYGDEVPFIKTPDMHASSVVVKNESFLSEEGANSQSNKFIPPHSIMVACIGNKLGVVALNAYRAQTNQQINNVIPFEDYLRYYAYFVLTDIKGILEAMGGGATMPNVNKSKFESIPAIIPEKELLIQFHGAATPLFKQIQTFTEANVILSNARDLLLPRLMNGEIAV
ncbi:MAG: restriction endonuclease subunit S [Deltaproteobacteria bacterium]|nr:restriction endonuclease subunit S [Deltaproteobacteria bacterium]